MAATCYTYEVSTRYVTSLAGEVWLKISITQPANVVSPHAYERPKAIDKGRNQFKAKVVVNETKGIKGNQTHHHRNRSRGMTENGFGHMVVQLQGGPLVLLLRPTLRPKSSLTYGFIEIQQYMPFFPPIQLGINPRLQTSTEVKSLSPENV